MEIIPFLIFAVIAFNIFRGFTKATGGKSKETRNQIMRQLKAQMEEARSGQSNTPNMSRYREKTPTERGREQMALRQQNSPWDHEHDLDGDSGAYSPGARVAANYLKKARVSRKASHKSPVQRGRRGANMDQNRNRTDEWGERGDKGFLNAKTLIILLVIGGALLYALSQMPAN